MRRYTVAGGGEGRCNVLLMEEPQKRLDPPGNGPTTAPQHKGTPRGITTLARICSFYHP